MDVAISIGDKPIRLTAERWFHMIENHDDLAGYYDDVLSVVEGPDLIIPGYRGSIIAVRAYGRSRLPRSVCDGWVRDHSLFCPNGRA